MEEQDGEIEKWIDEASAQVAVSQIYTLLISVDCEKQSITVFTIPGTADSFQKGHVSGIP